MAQILFGVPRSALALIPYYARFTASVHQYFKDMGAELVRLLTQEFTELHEANDVVKTETKVRNARFIGELTKFQVCAPQLALECLKTCLDDFHAHNIEVATNLLETCGKYLARCEESQLKFAHLLDFLTRLKESKSFFGPLAEENISSKLLANLEAAI